jgi:hypothetical protein
VKKSINQYSVIYEKHKTTERCIAVILPEFGLPCKTHELRNEVVAELMAK